MQGFLEKGKMTCLPGQELPPDAEVPPKLMDFPEGTIIEMDVKKEELPLNLWGKEVMTKDIPGWPKFAKNNDYSCTISVDGKVIKKLYPVPDEYTFAVSSEGDAQSFETTM